jgi:hypothetical protein
VPALPIPTFRDRLRACFRFRHRFLHVFGAPSAIGALAAIGGATALNPDTGLLLGALVAAVGTTIAGYYVTAGFDRGLVEQLQAEKARAGAVLEAKELERLLVETHPEIRANIERILATHAAIEAVFLDGVDDSVERILDASRADLKALRDRAVNLVALYRRLGEVIEQADGRRLWNELNRLKAEAASLPPGAAKHSAEEAFASTERTYAQWHNAVEKHRQVKHVLTVIEKNLEEFKLVMALRKADAVDGGSEAVNVSEFQSRLHAAVQACDELVGRPTDARRNPRRARA